MKRLILKNWVIYGSAIVLYGTIMLRISHYSLLDALLVVLVMHMIIECTLRIINQKVKRAYIAGIKKGMWIRLKHPNRKHSSFEDV